MPEEVIVADNTPRDAEVAAQKPNLDALSNDAFLNQFDSAPKVEEQKQEVKEEVKEEKPAAEVADAPLEIESEKKEEKPIEEVKEEVVESNELSLDTEDLTLPEDQLEPEEGTWKFVAKQDGIDLAEDSYEAFKEALTKPLLEQLQAVDSKKMEDYFVGIDPQIRMQIELNKAGMSFDEINKPLEDIAKYKTLNAVELYREDLVARYPTATQEWIDADVEKMVSIDGAIEHEATRINMELDAIRDNILKERNELIEKYKVNSENYFSEQKKQQTESIVKALNEIPELMGSAISSDTKKKLADNASNGKYDQLLNDPALKAEFIAYHQLKGQVKKAHEAAIAKSYAKGKLDISKELHNTPPLEKGGAGTTIQQTGSGAFDKLDNDAYLRGKN